MANFSFFFLLKNIHYTPLIFLSTHCLSFLSQSLFKSTLGFFRYLFFSGYFGSAGHSSLYSTPPPAQPPPPPHHYHSTPPSHQYHSIPPLPLVHSTPPPHQYHSPSLCPAAAPQHWGQISQLPPPIPSMTAEFTNFAKEWFIKR